MRHSPEANTFDFYVCFPPYNYSGDLEQKLLVSSHQSINLPLHTKMRPNSVLLFMILHNINFI